MRRLAALVLLALSAAACRASELSLDTDDTGPGIQVPGGRAPDPDDVVAVALDDLTTYWTRELPVAYDIAFTPLRGGYVPYGPTTELPDCNEADLTYDDIAENALYCPTGDLIAWDRVALIPALQEKFGPLTVAMVMAHEFAHAVQDRAEVDAATVTIELQADCFAGAWVGDADGRIDAFTTDGESLDLALAGLLELRDQIGVDASDPQAHGSGFDRISAFQDGFEEGPARCVTYEASPPRVVAIPFTSRDDVIQGGNLPIAELIDPLLADLESFFATLFSDMGRVWDPIDGLVSFDPAIDEVSCGDEAVPRDELELASFYCLADDRIYIDGEVLVPALDEIGDFAFGGEIARLHAVAAQAQLGLLAEDDRGLYSDCVIGVYAAAEFLGQVPDQQLVLSPGDLDEIIIAFLAFGSGDGVTAFERTAAFRAGFLDGIGPCEDAL